MLLHQGSGYRIEDGYVEIMGGIRPKIIDRDRRYNGYENGRLGSPIERGRWFYDL
jgi:hypothetical protein